MQRKTTVQGLERRIAALETVVASLTAEKSNGERREALSGKFGHISGIERRGPTTHEKRETQIDFSNIGGKQLR